MVCKSQGRPPTHGDVHSATAAAPPSLRCLQSWHPAFASHNLHGDGHRKGAVRVLMTKDGGKFTEELVAFDAAARSYQYRIIESPAPVIDYVSTIQVKETVAGSTVVWSSTSTSRPVLSEADAKKLISGVYRAGLDNLARCLE